MISYKFRLYPNKEQLIKLDFTLDSCRFVYNFCLNKLNKQEKINKLEIQSSLPKLKELKPELRLVYSKVLQMECFNLFSNLRSLSKKKKKGIKNGKLRFKGKNWFKTFSYQQSGFKLFKKKLKLSKIGLINIKQHREVQGKIKQIILKKENENWFAFIVTDYTKKIKCGEKELGIDLGIQNYLTDNEGRKILNPYFILKHEKIIKRRQKIFSKKKKGSNKRKKANLLLNKAYTKLNNSRHDFRHKITTMLIKECKVIYLEDLNIQKMKKQSFTAKNISDVSWFAFTQMLINKAENAGCKIVKVNPKNTSKKCSNCGKIKEKMHLSQRKYFCNKCGFSLDRDWNAAINIYNLGKEFAFVKNSSTLLLEQEESMKRETVK